FTLLKAMALVAESRARVQLGVELMTAGGPLLCLYSAPAPARAAASAPFCSSFRATIIQPTSMARPTIPIRATSVTATVTKACPFRCRQGHCTVLFMVELLRDTG